MNTKSYTMDALVEQVRSLAQNSDEKGRKAILDSLQSLRNSIETPDDTIQRFTFYVRRLRSIFHLSLSN